MRRLTIFLLILGVVAIAGIFWYVRQKGYQVTTPPSTPTPTGLTVTEPTPQEEKFDVVSYTATSTATAINVTTIADKKRRIVFTDGDEDLKISLIRRITSDGQTALASFTKSGEQIAKVLGTIALSTANVTTLLDNFGSTEAPIISPDGKRIAYVVFSNADPDYGYSLMIMNTDGSNKRRLTRKETLVTNPAFNLDGSKLAFLFDTGNGMAIQTVPTDGSKEATILRQFDNEILYDLAWGAELVFGKRPKGETTANQGEIYRVGESGAGLSRVTDNEAFDGSPILSPNGKELALVRTTFEGGKFSSAGELTLLVLTLADKTEIELGQADGVLGWRPLESGTSP